MVGSGRFKTVYRGFDEKRGIDVAWSKIDGLQNELSQQQVQPGGARAGARGGRQQCSGVVLKVAATWWQQQQHLCLGGGGCRDRTDSSTAAVATACPPTDARDCGGDQQGVEDRPQQRDQGAAALAAAGVRQLLLE